MSHWGPQWHSQRSACDANAHHHTHTNSALRTNLLPTLRATLRRTITTLDLSYNGGSKDDVKAMLAEVKRIIPMLSLPDNQRVDVRLWRSNINAPYKSTDESSVRTTPLPVNR